MNADDAVRALLDEGIDRGFFAGAAAIVATDEAVVVERYAGSARLEPKASASPAGADTLWDLASLTKPLAGAALVLQLDRSRSLSLEDEIRRFDDLWKTTRFAGVTLRRLLAHTAGVASWFPMYVKGEGRAAYRRTLAAVDPSAAPGVRVAYSCLGYLFLSEAVERASGQSLGELFAQAVADPIGLGGEILFDPPESLRARTAGGERDDATERRMVAERGLAYGGFRQGVVNGEVNDGNAFRRAGGVALNAGLFGTARAVAALGRSWLTKDERLLPEPAFADAVACATEGLEERRGLGWQLASPENSAGETLDPASFGHTGFTGSSLWIDPVRRRVFVLLANRLHPDARETDMNAFRRRFHAAARAA